MARWLDGWGSGAGAQIGEPVCRARPCVLWGLASHFELLESRARLAQSSGSGPAAERRAIGAPVWRRAHRHAHAHAHESNSMRGAQLGAPPPPRSFNHVPVPQTDRQDEKVVSNNNNSQEQLTQTSSIIDNCAPRTTLAVRTSIRKLLLSP